MCWQLCMHYAMGSFGMLMCALLLICVLSADRLACSMPIAVSACSWTRFAHMRGICRQARMRYAKDIFDMYMGVLLLIRAPSADKLACTMLMAVSARAWACFRSYAHHLPTSSRASCNCSFGTHMGMLSLICAPSADRLTCAMPIAVSTRICTCPSTFPCSKQAPGDRATKFSLMRARLP